MYFSWYMYNLHLANFLPGVYLSRYMYYLHWQTFCQDCIWDGTCTTYILQTFCQECILARTCTTSIWQTFCQERILAGTCTIHIQQTFCQECILAGTCTTYILQTCMCKVYLCRYMYLYYSRLTNFLQGSGKKNNLKGNEKKLSAPKWRHEIHVWQQLRGQMRVKTHLKLYRIYKYTTSCMISRILGLKQL